MAEKSASNTTEIRRFLLVSVVLAAIGVTIFILTRRPPVVPTTTNRPATRVTAVTPQAFTMVSGPITKLDLPTRSIMVDFTYIDEAGNNKTKEYTLTIADTTLIQSIQTNKSPTVVTTINYSELAVGNTIEAIGDTNVAPLSTFTPNTILQYLVN